MKYIYITILRGYFLNVYSYPSVFIIQKALNIIPLF